jgi:hypothetical protein
MKATEPLTDVELAEIEARRAAASPGPWRPGACQKYNVFIPYADALEGPHGERVVLRMNEHFPYEADASFVGHAWEDMGRLIATVAHLQLVLAQESDECSLRAARIDQLTYELSDRERDLRTRDEELARLRQACARAATYVDRATAIIKASLGADEAAIKDALGLVAKLRALAKGGIP